MKELRIKINNGDRYAAETIGRMMEIIGLRMVLDDVKYDIKYGGKSDKKCTLHIPYRVNDIYWRDLIDGRIDHSDIDESLPFDIVNSFGKIINKEINKREGKYDVHERLIPETGIQHKSGIGWIPVLNIYLHFFKNLLIRLFSVKPVVMWPKGKRACISLSHDVDDPIKYPLKRLMPLPKLRKFGNLTGHLRKSFQQKRTYSLDPNPDNYWLFDEAMDIEKERGLRSTFFFATGNYYSRYGTVYDVKYRIEDKRFIPVIGRMKDEGFGIGLHASYNSYADRKRIEEEKEKLEKIIGDEIYGVRHHYWHLSSEPHLTWNYHERCGFRYDSSISNNITFGFRNGIGYPYRPFGGKFELKLIEMPVMVMDQGFHNRELKSGDSFSEFERYLYILEKTGGFGTMDWHVKSSFPANKEFGEWADIYEDVLKNLEKRNDIWFATLEEVTDWWSNRLKKIHAHE